eukprot:TRINITY_DN3508_c0_g1_i1.p1 TRINITY_DN3508_c0_g1~~TRINITY_DN3508_c0_g1_i1.p1  ORF type:complete len:526 (-),score=122.47 TRINITY_DN3508_c0_g1_i1:38-1615(-)
MPMEQPNYAVDSNFTAMLERLRVKELKQILGDLGERPAGLKPELISRIQSLYAKFCVQHVGGELSEAAMKQYWLILDAANRSRHGNAYQPRQQPVIIKQQQPAQQPIVKQQQQQPAQPIRPANQPQVSSDNEIVPAHFRDGYNINPFFQFEDTLAQVRLKSLHRNGSQPQRVSYLLPQLDHQTVIHLYCFDMKNATPIHAWPTGTFEIKVNQKNVNLKKATKKLPDEVADLTPFSRPGPNDVHLTSGTFMTYSIVINKMKRQTVSSLMDRIKEVPYDTAFQLVLHSFDVGEGEIQEISTKITLRDPLTRAVITHPARATTCRHLQCFELEAYLKMNERVPHFKCPVCNKPALYKDLIIDSFFKLILSKVSNSDDTEVVIQPDGTWSTVKEGPVNATKRKADENEDENKMKKEKNSAIHEIDDDHVTPVKDDSRRCYICGSTNNTKTCSRCKKITYCGTKCQESDWGRHAKECMPFSQTSHASDIADTNKSDQETDTENSPINGGSSGSVSHLGSSLENAIVLDDD